MKKIPTKKEYDAKRYQKNKEAYKKRAIEWAAKNPEAYKILRKKINKKQQSKPSIKKKKAYSESMRRASKKNATPNWLTPDQLKQIKDIYINCPKGWNVDHIIPLQGKNVCGLHVPWNLRYLPASTNFSKKNNNWKQYEYPIIDFHLERDIDVSGVSGVGIVAYGCVLPSGKVVMEWNSDYPTIEILDNVGKLYTIHGHEGKTRIVMDLNKNKK